MNIERTFKGIKLTSNDKIILDYITKNIDTCLEEGVRGVAKNSFSSTSSIMRLSKKLGYSGFVELIYDLKKKMTAKKSEKVKMLHAAMPERKRARKVPMRKQSCASFFSPSAV